MLKFAKSNRFEKYEIHLLEHGKEKGLYRKFKKKKKEKLQIFTLTLFVQYRSNFRLHYEQEKRNDAHRTV